MGFHPKKVLIIRLSSIGDIVMTTPVIRSLKTCHPEAEIHFFTKAAFAPVLAHNPHIHTIHLFEGNLSQNLRDFAREGFDFVLDLHNNLRSAFVRMRLGLPSATYPKYNLRTRLYIRFRLGSLPDIHVVEKYGKTLKRLGCELDDKGLDFFLPDELAGEMKYKVEEKVGEMPLAVVLGATFTTKRWIPAYFADLLNDLGRPVVLLGGKSEQQIAGEIEGQLTVPVWNTAGTQGLLESAAILRACADVLTHDTGFMHIAAAFGMKIYAIWGQTVPELGFTPYKADAKIIQNAELACRPCHKLGYDACPKGHFKCMRELTPQIVRKAIQS